MQLLKRWGYLLLMAALFALCTFYFRDLTVPLILLGCRLGAAIYRNAVQRDLKKWLVPCGFVLVLFLGSIYHIADFILFPHSPRAAYRFHDACWCGALSALAGFIAEISSPAGKRIARDHAMNGTAI